MLHGGAIELSQRILVVVVVEIEIWTIYGRYRRYRNIEDGD